MRGLRHLGEHLYAYGARGRRMSRALHAQQVGTYHIATLTEARQSAKQRQIERFSRWAELAEPPDMAAQLRPDLCAEREWVK